MTMTSPRPLSMPSYLRRFRTTGAVTLWAVYVLFLVGAVVRGTGAGMGCPDWPKCFGRWVPPTAESQLPADYKQTYLRGRIAKNQKVAQRLDHMGFHEVAQTIFRNPASFIETEFNATKTWIEYVNRLVGALIGILITLTFIRSLPFWSRDRIVTWLALASLITVGIQGWLGSLVVSTNLVPAMVTWHMALGLLLLVLLHYAYWRSGTPAQPRERGTGPTSSCWWAWGLVVLTVGQILLGTQVRERVDAVAGRLNYLNRDLWIERLGPEFGYHRAFSTLLVLAAVYVAYRAWDTGWRPLRRLAVATLVLIATNALIGIGLATLGMPAWLQPLHLTVGVGLFGVEVMLALESHFLFPQASFLPSEPAEALSQQWATSNQKLEAI